MQRYNFSKEQIGETFLIAYAYHMGCAGPRPEDEYPAHIFVDHGEECSSGIFDLPSEAKKAARCEAQKAITRTGSQGWIWCVDRCELIGVTGLMKFPQWSEPTERWSDCGGHERMAAQPPPL